MDFRNFSLIKKLAFGFGSVLLIVTIGSALVLRQTRALAEIERLVSASASVVDYVDRLATDAATARGAGYKFIISGDKVDRVEFIR